SERRGKENTVESRRKGVVSMGRLPKKPYRVAELLAWAQAYRQRTGYWPRIKSGSIPEAPGETWKKVHEALYTGMGGLPGGSSMHRLLAEHLGAPDNRKDRPRLAVSQILAWADAWHARKGTWPVVSSGPIPEARGLAWSAVEKYLRQGRRGLPGGDT